MRIKSKSEELRVKPLFVQLALEPLWRAYGAVERGADYKVRIPGRGVQGLGCVSQGIVLDLIPNPWLALGPKPHGRDTVALCKTRHGS